MDRHLIAYLILAAGLLALAALTVRAVYYSPRRAYRRRRVAEKARWAARPLPHEDGRESAD